MISVIIPVYNCRPFLHKCIDSILSQSYENLEVICVDDNSSDGSIDILREYEKQDQRVKVIHKVNEGVSAARNVGLNNAKGDYILFVDGDDWIDSSTCKVALETITMQKADLVMWSYIREKENESNRKIIFDRDMVFDKRTVSEKLHRRMIGIIEDELGSPENADALCTVWGKLYRRSIIIDNGIQFYDIRKIGTYEDGLFNLKYLEFVSKAVFLNQYFYHYRKVNMSSITSAYNDKLNNQWRYLFHLMKRYIEKNNLVEQYKIALCNRISLSLIPLGINEMKHKCSFCVKITNLKKIISEKNYIYSIRYLKIQYMPIHWKIFFRAAKRKNAVAIFVLLSFIQKLRGN